MRAAVAMLCVIACKSNAGFDETEFVEREVGKLRAAFAAGKVTDVVVGCTIASTDTKRLPAALVSEIEQLCYADAPRLYLTEAIADVTRARTEHPGMDDLSCMQLFAGDAYKAIAKHPRNDPALTKLADDYARLCPKEVAKYRARAGT